MKFAIVMMMLVPIGLLVLAGYMMHIHQHGSGWVIAGAIAIGGSINYKETKSDK